MKTPELLAPAGGFDQLAYAIHFGADAVYLACDRFGLRQRAANFALADMPRAVACAHERGVAVHVTLNASMTGDDVAALPAYLEALAEAGADAFIMSDLGAVRLAKRHAPQVALHISTQASCMNAEAALMWYELGARRIVCAREMSVADIAAMREALPDELELEVFAHGAMCMAVSGRCLISDHVNGRSANKGYCTQPCRWTYALVEETRPEERFSIEEDEKGSFILSSKDLNMLHHLDDLARAGVDSIKIEGRVKKAYYVATVVNAYRQVLDGADPSAFDRDLEAVSHRPYSTGFFYGPAEQAPHGPEYAQTHALAGTVEACEARADGLFDVRIDLRNRFFEGDELEVLSPGKPVRTLVAAALRHVVAPREVGAAGGESDAAAVREGKGAACGESDAPAACEAKERFAERHVSGTDESLEPVSVADRATDSYVIACPFPLEPMDILRVER
ncbi:peptidase U32 family protein [Raoultibacter phocaeensis]|uniref:peptidase U32 family protein n=1 Tax=Raoultibacter phocaeensis TaxID=2479841 RepID=UPI001117E4F1|nr:U32 family peptidase [Raoultibacter phocaeensis]